jgi:hypothetical protein
MTKLGWPRSCLPPATTLPGRRARAYRGRTSTCHVRTAHGTVQYAGSSLPLLFSRTATPPVVTSTNPVPVRGGCAWPHHSHLRHWNCLLLARQHRALAQTDRGTHGGDVAIVAMPSAGGGNNDQQATVRGCCRIAFFRGPLFSLRCWSALLVFLSKQ